MKETTQAQTTTPLKIGNVILHDDPILQFERLSITVVKRFWDKVEKGVGCWHWTGEKDRRGGVITRGGAEGGTIGARKLAWLIYFGPLPKGRKIKNTCGDSFCVNPEHFGYFNSEPVPTRDAAAIERTAKINAFDPSVGDYISQDPTLPEGYSNTFRDRFWSCVDKASSQNGCWLWTAALQSDGYGCIGKGRNQKGNIIKAHQASWIMANGPVPEGLILRHKCPRGANKKCVNPAHLLTGTYKQNSEDSVEEVHANKVAYWNATLTVEQVTEMRRQLDAGARVVDVARQFNTTPSYVSQIKHRHVWTQLP